MAARLGSAVGLLVVAIGLAACGGASADEESTGPGEERTAAGPAKTTATAELEVDGDSRRQPQARRIRIRTRRSGYGTILVTGAGRTIYLFDREKRSKSECYGACAEAWPPVLARDRPLAGPGANQKLLGTTSRRDGKAQVTYAGHPLYLYAPEGRGEILCQDVFEYGGLWLIVRPSGKPVR